MDAIHLVFLMLLLSLFSQQSLAGVTLLILFTPGKPPLTHCAPLDPTVGCTLDAVPLSYMLCKLWHKVDADFFYAEELEKKVDALVDGVAMIFPFAGTYTKAGVASPEAMLKGRVERNVVKAFTFRLVQLLPDFESAMCDKIVSDLGRFAREYAHYIEYLRCAKPSSLVYSYDPRQSLMPREELLFLIADLNQDRSRPKLMEAHPAIKEWVSQEAADVAMAKWVMILFRDYIEVEETRLKHRNVKKQSQRRDMPSFRFIRQKYRHSVPLLPSITEAKDEWGETNRPWHSDSLLFAQ